MLKKLFPLLTFFSIITSCAKITALQGGPADTVPPKVISQNPKDGICGVSTKKNSSST